VSGLAERLARREVLILDGGTGTELERRGVPMDEVAWSASGAFGHDAILRAVHADYIRAGADIVITNTFATTRYMLEAAGQGERVREINLAAVAAARAARDEAAGGRQVWIAGSISPMAPKTDPKRRFSVAVAAASFREQAEILAEGGVDLIVLEMMRDIDYTAAAIAAAASTGLPLWVGFSCETKPDGAVVMYPGIAEDMPFGAGVAAAMKHGGSLVAVMHSDVADTMPALDALREVWDGPLGAYPHSGHFIMPHWQFDSVISPTDYLAEAERWLARGVQVIGGCCGIGPAHIRLLAERLPRTLP